MCDSWIEEIKIIMSEIRTDYSDVKFADNGKLKLENEPFAYGIKPSLRSHVGSPNSL